MGRGSRCVARPRGLLPAGGLLCLLLILAGCGDQPVEQQDERVLAEVNGTAITATQFEQRFSASRALFAEGGTDPLDELKLRLAFLDHLITRELIDQEARRLGLGVKPAEVDAALEQMRGQYPQGGFESMLAERGLVLDELRRSLRERLLEEKMVRQVIEPTLKVEGEDLRGLYQSQAERFKRPEAARIEQIVVADEQQARDLLEELAGGVEFGDLARAKSIGPEAGQGGELGWVVPGQLPAEMDSAIWSLQAGQVSEVVHSSFGWHIFRVSERRPAGSAPFEEVRPMLERELREARLDEAWSKYLDALRSQARITINQTLLGAAPGKAGDKP